MFLCLVNLRSCVQNLKRTRIQQVKQWKYTETKVIASNPTYLLDCEKYDQMNQLGTNTALLSITTWCRVLEITLCTK